jgi:hypothetical protein
MTVFRRLAQTAAPLSQPGSGEAVRPSCKAGGPGTR